MTHDETLYLAGLLEGEGSFGIKSKSPMIQVCMTDEDIIRKVQLIMRGGGISRYQKPNCKMAYHVAVYAQKAADVMRAIRPHMGQRRGKRIDEILEECAPRLDKLKIVS